MSTAAPTDEYHNTASFYDHVPAYASRGDVAFYAAEARASAGSVLELGCGTGRILIPCARAGVEMIGVDASPAMLERCKANLRREPDAVQGRITIARADMRKFDFGRKFRLIIIPFRAFQHLLSAEDQSSCLNAVKMHLLKDGRLIFDLFNPSIPMLADPALLSEANDAEFTMPDGRHVVRTNRFLLRDYNRQICESEMIYHVTHPDGRSEKFPHHLVMRYSFRFEIEHLLARVGLVPEQFQSDFQGSPFGSTYPGELVITARKITI